MTRASKRIALVAGTVLGLNIAGAGLMTAYAETSYGTCASPAPSCTKSSDCNDANHPDCDICFVNPLGPEFCTTQN